MHIEKCTNHKFISSMHFHKVSYPCNHYSHQQNNILSAPQNPFIAFFQSLPALKRWLVVWILSLFIVLPILKLSTNGIIDIWIISRFSLLQSAAMNTLIHIMWAFLLSVHLELERVIGYVDDLPLILPSSCPECLHQFTFPASVYESSSCSFLCTLDIVSFNGGWKAVSCGFYLCFPNK